MTWYEELRAAATGGPSGGQTRGLLVLQRDGMAAWLRPLTPVAGTPAPFLALRVDASGPSLPPRVSDEVVQVLANLVLRGLPGGSDHDPRADHP